MKVAGCSLLWDWFPEQLFIYSFVHCWFEFWKYTPPPFSSSFLGLLSLTFGWKKQDLCPFRHGLLYRLQKIQMHSKIGLDRFDGQQAWVLPIHTSVETLWSKPPFSIFPAPALMEQMIVEQNLKFKRGEKSQPEKRIAIDLSFFQSFFSISLPMHCHFTLARLRSFGKQLWHQGQILMFVQQRLQRSYPCWYLLLILPPGFRE